MRRRWTHGLACSRPTRWSRTNDTTQASTFFSDATNGTTTAFPEFIPDYNKGLSDFDATHNWVLNFTWDLPFATDRDGLRRAILGGWQLAGIAQVRSGNPLTVFVAGNRSRSLWAPSLGPGIGRDRPSYAPGRTAEDAVMGKPEQWFDPAAFVLQPAGTFGNTGRGDFEGPNLRTFDLAMSKRVAACIGTQAASNCASRCSTCFNRANFGPPNLTVFAGSADASRRCPLSAGSARP